MDTRKLYDVTSLNAVAGGDEAFVKSMIGLFLENIPSQSKELITACSEKNWERVYFISHKMKASIVLVNIVDIIQEIKTIEINAKTLQQLETLPALIQQVDEVVTATELQMKADYNL